MKKRFSIIIPAYNADKVVLKAVESIKNQKYTSYEIIVVDDCSTDKTFEVSNNIEGVQVLKTPYNMKDGGARNVGIDNAKGEYIIFLDADDYLVDENVLEKLNNIIGDNNQDLIYLGFESIGIRQIKALPTEENSVLADRLSKWKYANVWDVCWKREFLKENNIRFIEGKMFQDFLFYYEGILRAKSYGIASFVTHIYVTEENKSITTSKMSMQKISDLLENLSKCALLMKYVKEEDKLYFVNALQIQTKIVEKLLNQYEEENIKGVI